MSRNGTSKKELPAKCGQDKFPENRFRRGTSEHGFYVKAL